MRHAVIAALLSCASSVAYAETAPYDGGIGGWDRGIVDTGEDAEAGPPPEDAGDTGVDLGVPDLGMPDLGMPDLGMPDLGVRDLGGPDLGERDLGMRDLGQPDLGAGDLGAAAGGDAGDSLEEEESCGCTSGQQRPGSFGWTLLLLGLFSLRVVLRTQKV